MDIPIWLYVWDWVLRKSLFELLAIFQFILKDTFDEYKIIEINDKESGIVVNEKIWKNFKQKFY